MTNGGGAENMAANKIEQKIELTKLSPSRWIIVVILGSVRPKCPNNFGPNIRLNRTHTWKSFGHKFGLIWAKFMV